MKPARRIAQIIDDMTIKGGASNVVMWLSNALAQRGHQTTVFTSSYDPGLWPPEFTSSIRTQTLSHTLWRVAARRSHGIERAARGRQLSKMLAGFDIIIAHNGSAMQWVRNARKRNAGLAKIIWVCQEPTRFLFRPITDRHLLDYDRYASGPNEHIAEAVRRYHARMQRSNRRRERNARREIEAAATASIIVANSRFSSDNIEKAYSRKARVIYPGISPMSVSKISHTRRFNEAYICYVGRLSATKNVHNIIEAFRIVCENGAPNTLSLKIAGDGPKREELRARTHDYGLQDKISFVGQLSDNELVDFYRNARLTVYVPIDEPYGLVPLESLSHGTPVIVSNHGGPAELFTQGENALLVNPFDPSNIADAIAYCLTNEDQAMRMAEKGRALVESSFTQERYADQFEELLY